MKTQLLKALLATLLLAIGLNKASAAIDPTAQNLKNDHAQSAPGIPCLACVQGAIENK